MSTSEIWKHADQLIRRYGGEAADIATLRAMALAADGSSRDWFRIARAIRDFSSVHATEDAVN